MFDILLKLKNQVFPKGPENKRRRLIAICLISAFVANSIGQSSQMVIGHFETVFYNLCYLAFYTLCFLLNYKGRTLLAGYLMSFGCAFIIIFSSIILGFERNVLIFFIPLLIANYFLIDFKNSGVVLLQLLFPIIYMVIDRYYDLSVYQISFTSVGAKKFELIVSTTIAMAMSSVFVYFIIKDAFNNEKSIQHSINHVSQQNTELRKRNDELDRFVYSVSHELRSPITTMRGLTNLINQETELEEIRKYLELQEKCLIRLDDYIKDILYYYANDRLKLLIEEINFEELVKLNLEKFEFELKKHNIAIISSIQIRRKIMSDKYRINLILNNILSNAVKYYDANKPDKSIVINIFNVDNKVKISIRDNGIGISKSELPSIFKMFHKSEISSVSSGLGMYIVKESVEKIEGIIDIESAKREFTEVIILLPDLSNIIKINPLV